MDEILIGEKKYVSSKRAAKMTGYAKDYIGQLCREGRVPARLVGRSWYVLESAIEDHRFADKKEDKASGAAPASGVSKDESVSVLPTTWETPHYETSAVEVLPPIRQHVQPVEPKPSVSDENNIGQYLQDSWREWFEHVGGGHTEPVATTAIEASPMEVADEQNEKIDRVENDLDINVPIHVVYEPPPKELLPTQRRTAKHRVEEESQEKLSLASGNRLQWLIRPTLLLGGVVAVITVIFAVVGTGYLDSYITSISQVNFISGVHTYNK